jgi:hypothetical protein
MIFKNDVAHSFTKLVASHSIVGLPHSVFLSRADIVQLNCIEKKVRVVKMEYYDSENNLLSMVPTTPLQSQDALPGSIFRGVLDAACSAGTPNVGHTPVK